MALVALYSFDQNSFTSILLSNVEVLKKQCYKTHSFYLLIMRVVFILLNSGSVP